MLLLICWEENATFESSICFKNGLTSFSSLRRKISCCSRWCWSSLRLGGLGDLFLTAAVCGVSNANVIGWRDASSPFSSRLPLSPLFFANVEKNAPAATVVTTVAPNAQYESQVEEGVGGGDWLREEDTDMTAFASFCFVFVVVFFFFVSFFSFFFFFFFLSSSRRSPVNRLRISISMIFTLTFIASRNEGTNSFFFDDKDGGDDDDFVSAFFFFFALLLLPSVVLLPTGKLQTLRICIFIFEIKFKAYLWMLCGRIKRSIDIYRSISYLPIFWERRSQTQRRSETFFVSSLVVVRRFHFCCELCC